MKKQITILVLFILILGSGCRIGKYLEEDQKLIWKNDITVDESNIDKGELKDLLKQQPNRKTLLLFRTRLRAHNLGMNRDGKIGNWLSNSFGEAPVILDTNLCNLSEIQLRNYLNSKGYFNPMIDYSINDKKRFRTKIDYSIRAGTRYTINSYDYFTSDSTLLPFLQQHWLKPKIRNNSPYDEDLLKEERKIVTSLMNKNGFYDFSRDLIQFEVDSNLNRHALDVKMVIQKIPVRDSLITTYIDQNQYRIRKIIIYSDYTPLSPRNKIPDTTYLRLKNAATKELRIDSNFVVLHHNPLHLTVKSLFQAVEINRNDLYDINDVDKTYKQLSGLRNFRYINIQFQKTEESDSITGKPQLDCIIRLTPAVKQSFSIETELTNSAGDPGAGLNLVYQNKNLFKGAEIFDIIASGAVEIRDLFNNPEEENISPFYIIEAGGLMKLKIPKILSPFDLNLFPKSFGQKTVVESGYNFQKRPDYTRNIANFNFGYTFDLSAKERLVFNPLVLNLVKINKTAEFQEKLDKVNNPLLSSQYSDHLINSMQVSYIFRNPKISILGDHLYFRTNIEESGYVTQLISSAVGLEQDDNGSYRIFDIPFTQYIRMDFDFRYYLPLNENNQIAFRSYIGLGPSTGNLKALPFEKSFFAGGANGNRAWPIRSIGPGSYRDTSGTSFDKIGDYGVESSVEYRFPIYGSFKGALFVDVGNVWLQNKNPSFPGGEWAWDKFYKELAVGTGFGVRIDFDFLIFRIDFGIPIRDPKFEEADRWRFNDMKFKNIHTNIAVGYPF